MPVEANLTRQLNIRFIDARTLCTEAKVSLGVEGHPADDQEVMLIQEATQIFARRPNEAKTAMRRLKSDLDAVTRNPLEGSASSDSEDTSLSNGGLSQSNRRSTNRKFNKLWSVRGKR